MVDVGENVKEPVVLLAIIVPPQEPINNCHVPAVPKEPPFTVMVLLPPEQRAEGLAVKEVGLTELVLTFTVTVFELAALHTPLVTTAL